MKMPGEGVQLHTRGAVTSLSYEVVSNAKMMKLLSDSLYKDKIRAVIRELSTNAWDAHIVAGNNQPFDVQLPTAKDPTFRIRDYGTGMSPEAIKELYRKYGASDKTETNDLQGCMGLGSKSPFCYTRQFTTTSYYNGKKFVIVNAKDETGKPSIIPMAVEDTNEPNGLEISFATKKGDEIEFYEKAKSVYRPFPVKPNIVSICYDRYGRSRKFEPEKYSFKMEGKDGSWGIKRGNSGGYYDSAEVSTVVMGNVEYPIDPKQFRRADDADKDEDMQWYQYRDASNKDNRYILLLGLGLVINMDIGTVENDIGREGLQYTPHVIEVLKAKMDVILEEIRESISKRFDNCKSRWEARCFYHELIDGEFRNMRTLLDLSTVTWQGKSIEGTIRTSDKQMVGSHVLTFETGYGVRPRRRDCVRHITPRSNVGIFINDVERGAYAASQRAIESGRYSFIYLVRFDDDAAKKSFMDYVGVVENDLTYVSKEPKPKRTVAPRDKQKVFEFQVDAMPYWQHRYPKNWWKDTQIDMADGGLYVEINKFKVRHNNQESAPNQINKVIENLGALDIVVPTIYGVKTAALGKVKKHADWQCFYEWAQQQFETYLKSKNISGLAAKIQDIESFADERKWVAIAEISNPNQVKHSPLYEFLGKLEQLRQERKSHKESVQIALNTADLLGITINAAQGTVPLSRMEEKIQSRYSMLELIDAYTTRRHSKEILEYINMVDKCCPVTKVGRKK